MTRNSTRRVHLVRHAQSRPVPGQSADTWRLTEQGHAQAAELAEYARELPLRRVVTSVEPKAATTGRVIAQALGVPCLSREGLHEHERRTVPFYARAEEFHASVRRLFDRPAELVFGEESADRTHDRFHAAVTRVMRESHDDELIVTHGTVLSLLVSRANDIDTAEFWASLHMPHLVTLTWPERRLVAQHAPAGATSAPG